MVSKYVMKLGEYPGSVTYKLDCGCTDNDHITTIDFECDPDLHTISVAFYKNMVWTSRWGKLNWFLKIWKRIKCSIKILFTGWIQVEEHVVLYDEEHINSFIEVLQEGKQKMKEYYETSKDIRA